MKHHYVIRLEKVFKDRLTVHPIFWKDMINDRSGLVYSFYPELDALFARYQFRFLVAREYGRHTMGTWTEEEIFVGLDRFYRIILLEEYKIPEGFLSQLKKVPHIEDARELTVAEVPLPADVPPVATSFSLTKPSDLIHLQYARMYTKGDPSIRIAVLDTGVNPDHRELKGKVERRMDFVNLNGLDTSSFLVDVKGYDDWPEDVVGHGTHVSGILAAQGLDMDEGVCPECRILAVRVLATMKSGDRLVGAGIVDNINTGIKWAVDNGADIINMSLGIRHTGGGLPHEEVIRYAIQKNVTIVAASGNDGTDQKYYPGALPGVIAVGAVNADGEVAGFSSYGANIMVVAPGMNVYSSFTHGGYAFASGTSQASPFVAGSIGLLKSYAKTMGRRLNNKDLQYILRSTSDGFDPAPRTRKGGYGLINLADAFKLLRSMTETA
jgi:subtilisin family serine protease